jgi:four helix bundle protein
LKRYQDYKVWQDSHLLNMRVYESVRTFPKDEIFGLTSQMRRAASSIPMNIAEGSVKSEREFRQALVISLGSAAEVEYQLLMAKELSYLGETEYQELAARVVAVRKMLTAFIAAIDRALGRSSGTPSPNDQRLTTKDLPPPEAV